MRLELLTNSGVVDDSIRFIEGIKKKKDSKEELNAAETEVLDDCDCDAIEQELKEEQGQEPIEEGRE